MTPATCRSISRAMPATLHSSGDLAADRRYAWAVAALADGDAAGAEDLLRQTLDLAPDWAPAWLALGDACQRQARSDEAVAAWLRCRALDPQDVLGSGLRLAEAGHLPPDTAMPPAYVAALFDDYAPRFEGHLTGALSYRGPELVAAALDRVAPARRFARALDLGCGTGLAGVALRDRVEWLAGCDLSREMLRRTTTRGVYDEVACEDLAATLARQPAASLDLVVAADVLIYVPRLGPVLAAAARALQPGGLFALTLQTTTGAGEVIGPDLRVHHAPARFRAEASDAGFALDEERPDWVRRERGEPVPGLVAVLRRR
ncbi:class I SAM-dependent DNA methyltransferase [Alsobacter sp. R-9]